MTSSTPRISICTPAHRIPGTDCFLERIQRSLDKQTFRDFEWIVTYDGAMAENTNSAIKKAKGEIVKVLYMDDYLYSENAMQHINDEFTGGWLVSGCVHDDGHAVARPHYPTWNDRMYEGANTIGSPSVLSFENDNPLLFDESMSWTLDCDLYLRLKARYGTPTYLPWPDVAIGIGAHQMTSKLTDEEKQVELNRLFYKHTLQ